MAEALAVVGIIANIIQLVDFGTRVLDRLNQYQSTVVEIPEAFRHIKSELPVVLDALRQTKAAIDAGLLQDESKRALLPAVEGCSEQIKALDEVIKKTLPGSSDSWARRGRKALWSLRYDAKMEKITAVIRGYVQTLTYHAATSSKPSTGYTLPPPTPSSTVPFRRDDDFVSRDSLTKIRQISARPAARAALVGLGGVGKSQIAIEYAYQVRDESPDTWVFWVHAGTQARFEEGYRRIAEVTRMEGWDNPKADVLRLVRSWLCNESNGRWVMIIDNADDSDVFFPPLSRQRAVAVGNLGQAAEPLSDFLPQSLNGSILVTSRNQDVASRLTDSYASVIEVKLMDDEDALALLERKLGASADKKDAVELVHLLDCMPLAITQAAAFVKQRAPRMTISRYVEEVCRSDHDRTRLLKNDMGDSRRDGRASNSIIATWQISFEHIRTNMPTAARLLSLMSLFDHQGILESLLHDRYQLDEDEDVDFENDIHTLISYSLVKMSTDGSEFEMHRLVQFSTKMWLALNNELELWKATYSALMDESYPVGRPENWPVCQALFPHVQAVVNSQPKDAKALEAWASVLFKAAWYATEMGQYNKAYEMGSAAFQVRETILGAEHPDTLNSLNSLGVVVERQGRYSAAEAMHQRGLEAKERVLGADHPSMLTSMANLASTYRNQGRWKDAEELEVQVMETRKTKLGGDHPDTLTSMANLASTYWKQGRMANLASTYRDQGRWKDAEELDVQVVETCKTKLGADHPNTLASMANLASTYRNQGRWKDAEELEVQVIETYKTKLGADHPSTLTSMANLASTYLNQGRWKDAEELEVQVMETRKTKLGADHPYTLASMANLAITWKGQGRDAEARKLMSECVRLRYHILGASHPHYMSALKELARWEAEQVDVDFLMAHND
ncbi:TPR-like protein [Lindgomyces ingoldianus]|uniref:TPR-like protein n=1 Tax=Lindgomyces ingoldianus TaxID=673940 RepID=A0ACB6RDF3_9PLEO|nr:TPR-like protein [Lindgomyces ingoldianus]KAF2476755.1 TPR-like protein [Lindgomyces ingoldianus]